MFQLNMKSNKSIYEQVVDNIKELIMTGVLSELSKLPSVRDLSKELTINPNTVQKAFKELEREGYIFTVSGKGTFVEQMDKIPKDPSRIKEALEEITEQFKHLMYQGISREEAKKMVEEAISKA